MLTQVPVELKPDGKGINNGSTEATTTTKAKLDEILESFQAFDSDMKIGTRNRREKDEHRISQLTSELSRLEKTLNQEIKRRVEMNKSVQSVSLIKMMEAPVQCRYGSCARVHPT